VLIAAATHDPYAPPAVTARLAEVLGHSGADVTTNVVDGGHELQESDLMVAADWLGEELAG
jgi:predicted esterase